MTISTLIPTSNFEVRKFESRYVKSNSGHLLISSQWAIWDLSANGWVCMGREQDGVMLPYSLGSKKVTKEAISQGLYNGYTVLKFH